MRAEDLRRLLQEEDVRELGACLEKGGDLTGLFFRMLKSLASHAASFRLEPEESLALAGRAAVIARGILTEAGRAHPDRDIVLADAASERWRRRSAARQVLEARGAWIDARIVGSLMEPISEQVNPRHPRWLDGSIVAEALLVAARERRQAAVIEAYRQEAEHARRGDIGAGAAARRHAFRLLPDFYENALSCGFKAREARAVALNAAERLTGRAQAHKNGIFALAAAAVMTLPVGARRALSSSVGSHRRKDARARRGSSDASGPVPGFSEVMRDLNDWRARTLGIETRNSSVRRFGAGALGAVYGFSWGWRLPKSVSVSAPRRGARYYGSGDIMIDDLRPVRLSEIARAKLDSLALDGAHARLRQLADDGRETSEDRRRYEALHEALGSGLRGLDVRHRAFASWLGVWPEPPVTARLSDGARLWWAAPGAGWPAVCLISGSRGRILECRAVADAAGRLVGYAGFDVLSREFHGEPFYALYDISGSRVGRLLPVEGGGRASLGRSRQAFITAPESISLAVR